MSRNYKLFMSAAVLFYLAGLMNEAPALYVMAGVCLACVLGCYLISRLGIAGLDLSVTTEAERVWGESDVSVHVDLTNVGLIARPPVRVRIPVNNTTLQIDEASHLFALPGLSRSQSVAAEAVVGIANRGRYVLHEPRLIGGDPLGMFERPGPPAPSASFIALPRPLSLPPQDLTAMLSERTRLEMASRRQRAGEFFGTRRYEPGDELRDVHWKVTAHTGELVVKEYAGGTQHQSAVWLDTDPDAVLGSGADSSFEVAVVAAATLLQGLSGVNINTALFGDALPPELRSPETGAAVYRHAIEALATVTPSALQPFYRHIRDWSQQTTGGMTVFVITPGLDDAVIRQLTGIAVTGVALRVMLVGSADAGDDIHRQQMGTASYLRAHHIPAAVARQKNQLQAAFAELGAAAGTPLTKAQTQR
ncbi:MAG: DUF58 domain-containing protein [Armatimonadota bacterium]